MSDDKRSQVEIDAGAALDAVETAAFEIDELLLSVLDCGEQLSSEARLAALQDAATIMHYGYNALRWTTRAFERRQLWPDLSRQGLHVVHDEPSHATSLTDGRDDLIRAKQNLEKCSLRFVFEAADNPDHWCRIASSQYGQTSDRVAMALDKVQVAIDTISRSLHLI